MSDIETIVSDLKNAHWEAMDEINRLRAELAGVTEERDRMRDVLKPFSDAASTDDYVDDIEIAETDTARKITFGDLRRARAAIEGVTDKKGAGNE